jgi:putative ABC transport system permease protein
METLINDIRYGVRSLIKQPAFTLVAVVTLALGIGANTAIFSVVNGVLLRPLAYQEPEKIMTVLQKEGGPVSPANFLDLRKNSQSFSQVAAAEAWGGTLLNNDQPEVVKGLRMGDGLFSMLGVPPLLGRSLQFDDYQPGRDHVLVLSYKLWQRMFAGDLGVVRRRVTLNGESYDVVGVMPAEFQFPPFWSTRTEMWAPLDLSPRTTNRNGSSLRVFARLKEGVSQTQAQAEMTAVSRQLAAAYPDNNTGLELRVEPLNEKVVGNVRPALLVLTVAVGFVLLIACANVACLLLARAATRQKEAALRAALGASRWRILRQLLTESLLLSLCGAGLGILLAVWGVSWLTALLGGNATSFSIRLPRVTEIKLDAAVLVFTFTISVLTTFLFGLAPALAASKPDLNRVFKEGGRGSAGGRRRLQGVLVVAELSLALVLLIGASLLMTSFMKLQAIDPGMNARNLLTLSVSLNGGSQYVGSMRETFYQQLLDRISAVPGVESASAINHLPLAGDVWGNSFIIEGRPLPLPGHEPVTIERVSRPGYFRTMGIPLRAGRDFTDHDTADAPGVVVINEQLAQHYWPSEDPIGRRITTDDPKSPGPAGRRWLTIVGVIRDVKQGDWMKAPVEEIYEPFQQRKVFYSGTANQFTSMTLVVRTTVAPQSLAPAIQDAIKSVDRSVPVTNVVTMEQVIADTLWQPRFNLQLIGLFAGVSMVLAAIGLYGVMSYSVAQRTQEVGLRMALGAERRDIMALLLGQGMKLALAGVAWGLLAAFALTRMMTSMLFEIKPTDLTTYLIVSVGLIVIALLACYIPARRATKVDPLVALRTE